MAQPIPAAAGQPADLPIPAPANWRRLSLTNDEPVLASCRWTAIRHPWKGTWAVYEHDARTLAVLSCREFVVDDFGQLVALTEETKDKNSEFWWSTYCIDEAANDWARADDEATTAAFHAQRAAQRTRDLLQPPRMRVQIDPDPVDYPTCAFAVVIAEDTRLDVPTYCLRVGREERVIMTEVQLAALAMAIGQILPHAVSRARRAH